MDKTLNEAVKAATYQEAIAKIGDLIGFTEWTEPEDLVNHIRSLKEKVPNRATDLLKESKAMLDEWPDGTEDINDTTAPAELALKIVRFLNRNRDVVAETCVLVTKLPENTLENKNKVEKSVPIEKQVESELSKAFDSLEAFLVPTVEDYAAKNHLEYHTAYRALNSLMTARRLVGITKIRSMSLEDALKACAKELHMIHAQYGDRENARQHSAALRMTDELLEGKEKSSIQEAAEAFVLASNARNISGSSDPLIHAAWKTINALDKMKNKKDVE